MHEPFSTGIAGAMRTALVRVEIVVGFLLLLLALLIAPYYKIEWPGSGRIGSMVLLGAGVMLAVLMVGPLGARLRTAAAGVGASITLSHVIIFGIVAQILVAMLTNPVPVSDGKTYLSLAALLGEGRYVDPAGNRAFWPPGLPLVLAPFVALFGPGMLAAVLANLLFYVAGALGAARLGREMFDERAGVLAALLFTLWPSRLLTAAVVSKENLTVAAMLAGATLTLLAFRRTDASWWKMALGAGFAYGVAALAQPGLLLFVLMIPLAYRCFLASKSRFAAACALIFMVGGLTLLPWHLRNCYIFDGQFCGLATNGGSVFYRANNPLATGEWTAEGEVPITHLPELEQNKLGFVLGKRWIAEHPAQFLALSFKKLTLLLRDDRYGAYWSIYRGQGGTHEESTKSASPSRLMTYGAAHWISLAFWILIVAWAARALAELYVTRDRARMERSLVFLYPLLYSAVVFSVFESDRRQHLIALAFLIVLAAGACSASARKT